MEDVLNVYGRPHDPARTFVCLDETSRQLLADARPPWPPAPGRPARHDPESVRGGAADVLLLNKPLRGWREVLVSDRRTRLDGALCVAHPADDRYPDAGTVVLVMDRPNTHSAASLDAAFPPAGAKRLADRLKIHHIPKHGSWLKLAEIELAVLQLQCSRRRFGDRAVLAAEAVAWAAHRIAVGAAVDRQFTTADPRTKLKRRYPPHHG